MTDTIKAVGAAVEAVLGMPATSNQVVQTIEAIEVLVGNNKQLTKIEPSATQPYSKIVEEKLSPKKTKAKRSQHQINWKYYQGWFDSVLDGNPHIVTYYDLRGSVPVYNKINRSSFRNRLRDEAVKRGFVTVSAQYDDKIGCMRIEASRVRLWGHKQFHPAVM